MKILIVDDEIFERVALEKILNKYYKKEIDCIKSAINGEQAVDVSRAFDPDIIFMDIKMPRKNGIEASLKIREENKKVKIIIVTAFSDFSFAKKAISCNVSDYLVKPYSVKTLKSTVEKVMDEIKETNKNNLVKQKFQQSIAYELFTKMIERETILKEKLQKYIESLYINENNYCFFITERNTKFDNLDVNIYAFPFYKYNFYLAVQLDMKLYEQIVANNDILSISGLENDALLIESVFIKTLNKLLIRENDDINESYKSSLLNEIKNNNIHEIKMISTNIINTYLLKYGYNNLFFDSLFNLVINEIQMLYSLNVVDAKLYFEKFNNIQRDLRVNDLEYFQKEYATLLIDIALLFSENRKSRQEKLVDNTIDYMKENYKINIGMDNISDAMNVSKSYLSRVFTKNKGITVMDYLLKIRINEAKKLLIEGNTISYTSYEVGFSNPAYFSKLFKKESGVTPSQFIENNNKEIK